MRESEIADLLAICREFAVTDPIDRHDRLDDVFVCRYCSWTSDSPSSQEGHDSNCLWFRAGNIIEPQTSNKLSEFAIKLDNS